MKHFKKENAGRSMTEMLGVLAIIGVLSLGGVVGYRYAMNYYAANQIAYEVNLMRNDAKIKIAQGAQELSLGNPYDKQGDENGHLNYNESYKVAFDFTEDPEAMPEEEAINGYYIELSGIPQGICNPLANLLNNMSERAEFKINDDSNECDQPTNILYIAFEAENLNGNTGEPGFIPSCDDENCNGYCNANDECVCNSNADCKDGLACMGGTCGTCEGEDDCNPAHCKSGKCITCEVSEHWSGSDCVSCNGTKPYWDGNNCVECTAENSCDGGKVCHNGICENCSDGSQCSSNYCKEGRCTACTQSRDCGNGVCVEGMCFDSCSAGRESYCDEGTHCGTSGQCETDCTPATCSGTTPICDTNTHECRGCTESDCAGKLCVNGQCINCTSSASCGKRACDNGICYVSCFNHESGCDEGTHCSTMTEKCEINCTPDFCQNGEACDLKEGVCTRDCTLDSTQCPTNTHCNRETKKCELN